MPKQIQTPTFGQSLVRMFGLKGRYQPVLDETIVPVVSLGSTNVQLDQERRFGRSLGVAAAGAGKQTVYQIGNPLGSGISMVVREVWLEAANGTTDVLMVEEITEGASGVQIAVILDSRALASGPRGRMQGFGTVSSVEIGTRWVFGDDNDPSNVWYPHIVLMPGFLVTFRTLNTNIGSLINVVWSETPLAEPAF